ncbi:hypothetical protein GGS23DRAFT_572063 [Durotheca rogersii]|uniref:uncharacterized protein n=1 Tax=Durotheca rogersii TaxID=419775 RepID=UPI002220AA20|nr:uncharacterized protein GGS23DRAFT_572063 [Durotheca rogersii]KAI5862365.1 hypothetical protein GGS23DRAFT_572063 [Durotheca rogersii]
MNAASCDKWLSLSLACALPLFPSGVQHRQPIYLSSCMCGTMETSHPIPIAPIRDPLTRYITSWRRTSIRAESEYAANLILAVRYIDASVNCGLCG